MSLWTLRSQQRVLHQLESDKDIWGIETSYIQSSALRSFTEQVRDFVAAHLAPTSLPPHPPAVRPPTRERVRRPLARAAHEIGLERSRGRTAADVTAAVTADLAVFGGKTVYNYAENVPCLYQAAELGGSRGAQLLHSLDGTKSHPVL